MTWLQRYIRENLDLPDLADAATKQAKLLEYSYAGLKLTERIAAKNHLRRIAKWAKQNPNPFVSNSFFYEKTLAAWSANRDPTRWEHWDVERCRLFMPAFYFHWINYLRAQRGLDEFKREFGP